MQKIFHLSDLHFGRVEADLIPSLLSQIERHKPDLVIISGDFTQRAKTEEFIAAENLLRKIDASLLCIPGNHDIPLYRFWERLFLPYRNYKKYISPELESRFINKKIAVAGINTTYAFTRKEGQIQMRQLKKVREDFRDLPEDTIKIIVSHHPFNTPVDHPEKPLKSAEKALSFMKEIGIDLLLSGHLHTNMRHLKDSAYRIPNNGPLLIHAGTAISSRLRNETNSFNLLILNYPDLEIIRFQKQANSNQFIESETEKFTKSKEGWKIS